MTVRVRFFASYADRLGRSEIALELPAGSTVDDVIASVSALPGATSLPPQPLIAVNLAYARPSTALTDGDEIAFIPPVAGG